MQHGFQWLNRHLPLEQVNGGRPILRRTRMMRIAVGTKGNGQYWRPSKAIQAHMMAVRCRFIC